MAKLWRQDLAGRTRQSRDSLANNVARGNQYPALDLSLGLRLFLSPRFLELHSLRRSSALWRRRKWWVDCTRSVVESRSQGSPWRICPANHCYTPMRDLDPLLAVTVSLRVDTLLPHRSPPITTITTTVRLGLRSPLLVSWSFLVFLLRLSSYLHCGLSCLPSPLPSSHIPLYSPSLPASPPFTRATNCQVIAVGSDRYPISRHISCRLIGSSAAIIHRRPDQSLPTPVGITTPHATALEVVRLEHTSPPVLFRLSRVHRSPFVLGTGWTLLRL